MKRTISFLVALCILFGSLGSYAFAASESMNMKDIENALIKLEEQRDRNLELIKEQLEEQGGMEYYDLHAELVELEYESLKNKILGLDNELMSGTRRIYVPNGGQIEYRVEPSDDWRTHAHFIIEAYNKEMTETIIDEFDRGNRGTLGDLATFVVVNLLGWKIPGIGPLILGFDAGTILSHYLKSSIVNAIEESDTQCLLVSTSAHYGGKYTVWRVWDDMPYISIPPSTVDIDITEF